MVSNDSTLRASEFAVTLNGDNHNATLKVLKQFAKTLRKEREIALALNDNSIGDDDEDEDEDDDWSDEEMEVADDDANANAGTNGPPTKKYKKSEEWKADTSRLIPQRAS